MERYYVPSDMTPRIKAQVNWLRKEVKVIGSDNVDLISPDDIKNQYGYGVYYLNVPRSYGILETIVDFGFAKRNCKICKYYPDTLSKQFLMRLTVPWFQN